MLRTNRSQVAVLTPDYPGKSFLIYRYISRRRRGHSDQLPDLPVPAQFRPLFRDWAERHVNFVEYVDDDPDA